MEPGRGPVSPRLPVKDEAPGLCSRRGGLGACIPREPRSPGLREIVKRAKPFMVLTFKCYQPNWLLGYCVLSYCFLGQNAVGPMVDLCYGGPLTTRNSTPDAFLSYPPVENGIEWDRVAPTLKSAEQGTVFPLSCSKHVLPVEPR